MEITLHTEGWFDAAHHLDNYSGNCKNIHGHTYKVEVWVRGEKALVDKAGILWDFGKLKTILNKLDHPEEGELNNILGYNPTAENLVCYIYNYIKIDRIDLQFRIRVYEQIAPKQSWAEIGDF